MQDGSAELQRLHQTCRSAPSTSRGTGLNTGQVSMPSHSSRGNTALSGSPSSLLYKTPRGTAAATDNLIATSGHVSSREASGAAAAGSTQVPAGPTSGGRSSSNGRRSSSGGSRGHNPSPRSSKPSGYTAALLKRKAAAALQTAPPGASKQQMLLQQQKQQQQQQQAGDLGALAAQLLCSRAGSKSLNHASTPECSSVAVAAAQLAAGTTCLLPSAGRLIHKQHQQQQEQQQQQPQQQALPALQVCSAHRRSSGGGGISSGGSYAAQASSRAVQLSARGVCSSKEGSSAAATAAAAAVHSSMMAPSPAGAACPSQQLSSALSALEAVTAANTAAAAMLRAVASEAARNGTAGATLQQRAALVPDKAAAAAAQAAVADVMYENQGEQQVPLLHLGQLPLQQQQVQLQQVFEGLQLCHSAAAVGRSQPGPRGAAAAGEVLLSFRQAAADTALADRSAAVHRQAGGAPETAVTSGSMAAGVELLPAGGVGYSKLRRLHASSSGAVAAAASPRLQHLLTNTRFMGVAAAAAGQHQLTQELGAADTNISCTVPVHLQPHHQQRHDRQQEQQQQGQDGAWASVDVVTSWYHAADDDEDDDGDVRQGLNPPQAASQAAAAAALQPPPPPAAVQQGRASPRLRPQQPVGGGQIAACLLTAPASPSHWSTGGGIEYAKLLRSQIAPPDHLAAPRCHHQQQQQQQVLGVGDVQLGPAINPAEEQHSGTQLSAGLITGWYGGGLQSNGSEHGSSGRHSPEAVYSQMQQQLQDANLPVACGDAHSLLEGPGMLASRQRFTSSSSSSYGGWSETDIVLPSCHGWDSSSTCVFAADAPGLRVQGSGRLSTGQVAAEVVPVGSFDLRPCLPVPLLSARDASVTQLLEASQHQINCMESTLASMLLVAKRWTDGGAEEAGCQGDSLRGRFKP